MTYVRFIAELFTVECLYLYLYSCSFLFQLSVLLYSYFTIPDTLDNQLLLLIRSVVLLISFITDAKSILT